MRMNTDQAEMAATVITFGTQLAECLTHGRSAWNIPETSCGISTAPSLTPPVLKDFPGRVEAWHAGDPAPRMGP